MFSILKFWWKKCDCENFISKIYQYLFIYHKYIYPNYPSLSCGDLSLHLTRKREKVGENFPNFHRVLSGPGRPGRAV